MKVRYTMTMTVDIDLDPENFPEGSTVEEMMAIDLAQFEEDPSIFIGFDGDCEFKGEPIEDHLGLIQRAQEDGSFKALLFQWETQKSELTKARNDEMSLRKAIANTLFPDGKEGTNKCYVEDVLVAAVLKINRSVDKGRLSAYAEEFREFNINLDELISYKPELKVGPYRKLSDQQRAVFNQALTIRDGAPDVEIRPGKR